jgi:adenosine deaminase
MKNLESSRWASLKKTELHRHLDCSIRPQTLRELLIETGENVPVSAKDFAAKYLVKEPMRDLGAVLGKFLAAQKALFSEVAIARVTRECIEDAAAEGIDLLELRYAPTFIQDGHEGLSFEAIHRGILAGIQSSKHLPVNVGLIAIFQRIKPVAVAASVMDFVLDHRDTFVGVDLADNEDGFDARPFEPIFGRARQAGLRITVHAGEAPIASAADNVTVAMDRLGAERIGHGIQIANPEIPNSKKVLEEVARRGVLLELCPTSNVLTNAVKSVAEHPLRRLRQAGVKVSINTDDPGVFDFNLTHEYDVVADQLGLTADDFEELNVDARKASFLKY